MNKYVISFLVTKFFDENSNLIIYEKKKILLYKWYDTIKMLYLFIKNYDS